MVGYNKFEHKSYQNKMAPLQLLEYMLRASAKNNCTILLGLWSIYCVALKATYLDMQPSMRLADEPNPGAI
jgi:hypothetical protein